MKQFIFLVLVLTCFIITSAQTKPTTRTKPTPKPQTKRVTEVTEQKATTLDGKSVLLKSDGTWQFSSVKTLQKSKTKPCELTLENAPIIRGLQLGMKENDTLQIFRFAVKDYESPSAYISPKTLLNGVSTYKFDRYFLERLQSFRDVNRLELQFFKDELHSISIEYSMSGVYFTRQEFKLKISESFNLPVESWVSVPDIVVDSTFLGGAEILKCVEFQVTIIDGDEFTLTNLLTTQKIKGIEEDKRKTFKP